MDVAVMLAVIVVFLTPRKHRFFMFYEKERRTNRPTDGQTYGWTDLWTDGPTDGRTYGRTDPLIEMRGRI